MILTGTIFVPIRDIEHFYATDKYFWMCSNIDKDFWRWTYSPNGIEFLRSEDAAMFKLNFDVS